MGIIPVLETARLSLRGSYAGDLEPICDIVQDKGVLRYLPRDEPWPQHVAANWLTSQYKHWAEHHYGWWLIEDRGSRNLLGWCGLRRLQETGEVELLYLLRRSSWGRGIASEAAIASVRFGLTVAELPEIIGLVHPDNIASIRVLDKTGLRRIGECSYFGMQLLKYRIIKPRHEG